MPSYTSGDLIWDTTGATAPHWVLLLDGPPGTARRRVDPQEASLRQGATASQLRGLIHRTFHAATGHWPVSVTLTLVRAKRRFRFHLVTDEGCTPISVERNAATIWDETAQFLPRKSDDLRRRVVMKWTPYSQKTQMYHFHSIYGLTVARSSSCNPPPYSPYSLPRRDNERLWWYALWTGSNY